MPTESTAVSNFLTDTRDFLTFLKSGPVALVNLGKNHLDHQSLENFMQSKRTGPQFYIENIFIHIFYTNFHASVTLLLLFGFS